MSENSRSLPESLDVSHLSLFELREHLVHLTLEYADALMLDGDYGRVEAISALYESTLNALNRRQGRRS
jgi:hypothetical protein